MDEESDEEIEDRDKVMELVYSPPHLLKMKMMPRKLILLFGPQELGIRQIS